MSGWKKRCSSNPNELRLRWVNCFRRNLWLSDQHQSGTSQPLDTYMSYGLAPFYCTYAKVQPVFCPDSNLVFVGLGLGPRATAQRLFVQDPAYIGFDTIVTYLPPSSPLFRGSLQSNHVLPVLHRLDVSSILRLHPGRCSTSPRCQTFDAFYRSAYHQTLYVSPEASHGQPERYLRLRTHHGLSLYPSDVHLYGWPLYQMSPFLSGNDTLAQGHAIDFGLVYVLPRNPSRWHHTFY
ncbi:hypothetical protein IW262DRAFT_975190 [Armillaria fumosa]|nr:hypothetical protein IW262DRAFT_975190 [Armillaria fumosa]